MAAGRPQGRWFIPRAAGENAEERTVRCFGGEPMVLGYWLFDALLSSAGDPSFWVALSGAAAGIPGNLMQAVFGVAASTALTAALRKSPAIRREFPKL